MATSTGFLDAYDEKVQLDVSDPFASEIPEGIGLRAELSLRGARYAAAHHLLCEKTNGAVPSVVFGQDDAGRHGNFHPAAYERICATPAWAARLEKAHTSSRREWYRSAWRWKELDCANSSDALLMNVFCYPGAVERACSMLGVASDAVPEFGFSPRTPLLRGKFDNTEIDMRLGDLLVEAKLTESDFQIAKESLVLRYRDLDEVFDVTELTLSAGRFRGYQLIRGVLAAYAGSQSFCVLCDARRPDLVEEWFRVLRAVRSAELRCRLKLLTWQELSSVLPLELRGFLGAKYGIFAG